MTSGGRGRLDRVAALLILALVLALLWLGPVAAYLDFLAGTAEQLDLKQQTLLRYRALAREARPDAPAQTDSASLLFPEIPESQAVALLQESVKGAAAAAQIQVQGMQVLRSDALPGTTRIGLRVRASGNVGNLGRMLYAIEAARPLLHPDNLQIQSRPGPAAASGPAELLEVQFDVSGFKAGPPA